MWSICVFLRCYAISKYTFSGNIYRKMSTLGAGKTNLVGLSSVHVLHLWVPFNMHLQMEIWECANRRLFFECANIIQKKNSDPLD